MLRRMLSNFSYLNSLSQHLQKDTPQAHGLAARGSPLGKMEGRRALPRLQQAVRKWNLQRQA
jgi:hypothetical protein